MGSSKRVLTPVALLTNQSMGTSFSTPSTTVQYLDRVSYQLNWSGTPSGSAIIQGSLDNSTWNDLSISPAVLSGSPGSWLFDVQITGIPYLRMTYTRTSGTGSVTVFVSGKES